MTTPTQTLHSLLLPLNGFYLVLPQPTIIEIAPRPDVTPVNDSTDWLMGVFLWRAEKVPLISFEKLCGQASGVAKRHTYVAVLYALDGGNDLAYYAIELKAIPHPALLNPASLSVGNGQGEASGVIAADARIGGHRVVVPALEKIEQRIRGQLASAQIAP
jgi:chemotaxis signal transduction protein